ncbi:hypothetical protein [Comamonas sp. NLF-1-9]|uniref:hypothetical protein n=1 Tax=Comamonas sp. NLF-1-9 TaxID=2853163 RepID=UPI001C45A0B4|nr:hypothetical protein [Comamonas sp. NLF-1-9]QXL84922.1 hypothetical protein KUD94_02710 [Comamonas sp. NLF-1-9]
MPGGLSVPELLLLALLGLISAVLGRWAGARWRARRHERREQAERAQESRQVRRARERRKRQ